MIWSCLGSGGQDHIPRNLEPVADASPEAYGNGGIAVFSQPRTEPAAGKETGAAKVSKNLELARLIPVSSSVQSWARWALQGAQGEGRASPGTGEGLPRQTKSHPCLPWGSSWPPSSRLLTEVGWASSGHPRLSRPFSPSPS